MPTYYEISNVWKSATEDFYATGATGDYTEHGSRSSGPFKAPTLAGVITAALTAIGLPTDYLCCDDDDADGRGFRVSVNRTEDAAGDPVEPGAGTVTDAAFVAGDRRLWLADYSMIARKVTTSPITIADLKQAMPGTAIDA